MNDSRMNSPGQSADGAAGDDERWLAALAGRNDRATPGATALEAQLLRTALRRAAAAPALSPERERQLLAALDSAAAQAEASGWRCGGCARRWQALRDALRRWPPALTLPVLTGAALLSVLAGVLPLLHPPAVDGEAVLRGTDGLGVQVLRVADPLESRNRLAAELSAQGAQVRRYSRLGRQGLDALWTDPPVPPAARATLAAAGLTLPADAIVRVEFADPTP